MRFWGGGWSIIWERGRGIWAYGIEHVSGPFYTFCSQLSTYTKRYHSGVIIPSLMFGKFKLSTYTTRIPNPASMVIYMYNVSTTLSPALSFQASLPFALKCSNRPNSIKPPPIFAPTHLLAPFPSSPKPHLLSHPFTSSSCSFSSLLYSLHQHSIFQVSKSKKSLPVPVPTPHIHT